MQKRRDFWLLSRAAPALVVLASGTGLAQDLPFPPLHAQICDQGIVNKEKVATYLLRKYPVSIAAVSRLRMVSFTSNHAVLSDLLAAGPKICDEQCAKSDGDNLKHINGALAQLLRGTSAPAYAPTGEVGSVGPARYLKGPDSEFAVVCGSDAVGPVEAPGAKFVKPPKSKSLFRVRGNPDDLDVDRSEKTEFAATKKANLSFTDDHVAGGRTTNIVGYVGYAYVIDMLNGKWWQLIPYAGINRNDVEATGSGNAKPSRTSTASIGMLASGFIPGGSRFGHQVGIRPNFLADHEDGSRLAALNLTYTPTWNGGVNDFFSLRDDVAWAKWILSLKADAGWYVDRGVPKVEADHENFVRAGGKGGVAIVSANPYVPLEFTATHTSLARLTGQASIDHTDVTLGWGLDPNKYFGLTVTYLHGRREDTAVKENQWGVGIAGRF